MHTIFLNCYGLCQTFSGAVVGDVTGPCRWIYCQSSGSSCNPQSHGFVWGNPLEGWAPHQAEEAQ